MKRSKLNDLSDNQPKWVGKEPLSVIVYYSSLRKKPYLLYLDMYDEEPYSIVFVKFRTDLSDKGAISVPKFILEEYNIDIGQLNIVSEYRTYYVPFALIKIVEKDGKKYPKIISKQILGMFYSDLEEIFSFFPEVEEIHNVLYKPFTKNGKVNIKSIGRLLDENESLERAVNGLLESRYNSDFYTNILNNLSGVEEPEWLNEIVENGNNEEDGSDMVDEINF